MSASLGTPRDKTLPHIFDGTLSPYRISQPISRPSSRSSLRSHSPSYSLDDPVAVRQHMSSLKHNIRQQQAQLNTLENIVRSGPRPYSTDLNDDFLISSSAASQGIMSSPPSSFVSPNGSSSSSSATAVKMRRRSSHDVLQSIAGPESNLPLPKRDSFIFGEDAMLMSSMSMSGVREGVPMSFASANGNYKRQSSPTRTLSRIPISSVGNARALTEDGHVPFMSSRPTTTTLLPVISTGGTDSPDPSTPNSHSQPLPSPSKRFSLTPGGTTKVLADLQTGVVNARNALENTKAQLRMSQRTVASLTRQTEDLKESRERLRLENEGLNNVVARKERLLQEVLERARKAEAEVATLKAQLKSEVTTSKKSLRDMESSLTESTALSQRSEREYITLRDSMKHLTDSWKHDMDRLRQEMKKREDKVQGEGERLGKMYKDLVAEVKREQKGKEEVKRLWDEDREKDEAVRKRWMEEIERIKAGLEREVGLSNEANQIARNLSDELARLRRLMQRPASTDDNPEPPP